MSSKISGPPTFVFLEFLDPEVASLLNGLKDIFSETNKKDRLHITVRGPHYHLVTEKDINRYAMLLEQEPILIQSAGMFIDDIESVVYIKVSHNNLRKIWDKPDYPIKDYGFNPHITIYRGTDKGLAQKIYHFLKKEQIALLCHKFQLTTFVSKQMNLFQDMSASSRGTFKSLCKMRKIAPDIMERARCLMSQHKKEHTKIGPARKGPL